MPPSEPVASAGVGPQRLEALQCRILEIATMIDCAHVSSFEAVERLKDLVAAPDPWAAVDERRSITSVAARLQAVSVALLGLLGEHELVLADRDDLAAGLADRGVLIPRKCSVFKRKSRRQ